LAASERLGLFGESIIREMTRLSEEYGAINLAQGMPDFDPPSQLLEAGVEALRRGPNQYAMTWGQLKLRQAISAKAKEYNGIDADPEKMITVTCGSTEAVAAAILGLTNTGDRIVIIDPFYENYVPTATLAGAEILYVPFIGPDLRLDEEALKVAFEKKPKLIVVNTPNNPTGRVFDKGLLSLVADLCEDAGTVAVTDEIYEHIVYDGKEHVSLATVGSMHEKTVTVSSASKTYSVTGWRVGWAIAEPKLSETVRKVHDYLTICAPTPLQEAVTAALSLPDSYYTRLVETYDRKRRQVMKDLDEAGLEYRRPDGAYYILVNVPPNFETGQEFSAYLLKRIGLAVLPASALYHDKELGRRKVRIAFCKKDTTLREAGRRLKKLTKLQTASKARR